MGVDASENYLDFENLATVAVDPDLIRLLLPRVPTASTAELTMKPADGQGCAVMVPSSLINGGKNSQPTGDIDGLVSAHGPQNAASITRIMEC